MEKESFEDADTARLMNEGFVSIKVDREERPDIDSVYMMAVQAMTGQGGWPLTAFLTPEGEPFFGGTYFPPEPHPGLASFSQILTAIGDAYGERKDEVVRNARELRELLERNAAERTVGPVTEDGAEIVGSDLLSHAFRFLLSRFDATHGGFGTAPKFPQPVTLEFSLRVYARTGDRSALEMVTHTLHAMARGGIHDHLAGGFHRYSVDTRWLVPHFEKMLYASGAPLLAGLPSDRRPEPTGDHGTHARTSRHGHALSRRRILLCFGRRLRRRRGPILWLDGSPDPGGSGPGDG
jgi:uncharacterized protein YyaL (SSP411 family)